jgi:hypothetical protein
MLGPDEADNLEDPQFLAWVKDKYGMPLTPDSQDYGTVTGVRLTTEQKTERYRKAQREKLLRVYREWKAAQN